MVVPISAMMRCTKVSLVKIDHQSIKLLKMGNLLASRRKWCQFTLRVINDYITFKTLLVNKRWTCFYNDELQLLITHLSVPSGFVIIIHHFYSNREILTNTFLLWFYFLPTEDQIM